MVKFAPFFILNVFIVLLKWLFVLKSSFLFCLLFFHSTPPGLSEPFLLFGFVFLNDYSKEINISCWKWEEWIRQSCSLWPQICPQRGIKDHEGGGGFWLHHRLEMEIRGTFIFLLETIDNCLKIIILKYFFVVLKQNKKLLFFSFSFLKQQRFVHW